MKNERTELEDVYQEIASNISKSDILELDYNKYPKLIFKYMDVEYEVIIKKAK